MARPRPRRARRVRRTWLRVLGLVVVSAVLVTLDYRGELHGAVNAARRSTADALNPVERAVDDVLHPVGHFFAGAVEYGSLARQNAELRLELRRAEGQALRLGTERRELDQLARLEHLPFVDVATIPTVTAEVIGQSSSNFEATVTLDKGQDDGVAVGMPVVDGLGLVGRVVQVASHQATVELITDSRSVVSVTYGTGGALAAASGQGPGASLRVDYVPNRAPIRRGELLSTSGEQLGLYPPGIPVARVQSVRSTAAGTQASVSARPVADLGSLGFVDVLAWEPPG
jgi:rod shape-determining protein MreC